MSKAIKYDAEFTFDFEETEFPGNCGVRVLTNGDIGIDTIDADGDYIDVRDYTSRAAKQAINKAYIECHNSLMKDYGGRKKAYIFMCSDKEGGEIHQFIKAVKGWRLANTSINLWTGNRIYVWTIVPNKKHIIKVKK